MRNVFQAANTRRDFLKASVAGIAGLTFGDVFDCLPKAMAAPAAQKHFEIETIERVTVKVPFREAPARNMDREIPHWRYSEIFSVKLKSGEVGYGETLLYYTFGATEDDDVERARGKNAVQIMWDDELGAGLQMAIFDAVAKTCGVPVYALLGQKLVDKTPVAWWNIDTSPEDLVLECNEAYKQGYRAYKTKGRPWFDVWEMCEQAKQHVPADMKIVLDFNDTLLDAERGIPILKELAQYKQIAFFETPIFQDDILGNRAIRKATKVPVAMHFGIPDAQLAIRNDICDGFIIGGGASRAVRQGAISAMADLPFWLQIVGTGITGTWSKHFGAALSHAKWPAVTCFQLYEHQMLVEPIKVTEGFSPIPEGPGLGMEIDWAAVEKYKVPKPKQRPEPPRLLLTTWPDGRKMYVSNDGTVNFILNAARKAKVPFFERGVTTTLLPDDGSEKWQELYKKGRLGPFVVK